MAGEGSMPSLLGEVSLLDDHELTNIVTETVDLSLFAIGSARPREEGLEIGQENDAEDSQQQQNDCSQQPTQTVATAKKKRERFAYKGKSFKGGSDLFLDATYKGSFQERFPDDDVELVGTIVQCPFNANGMNYGFKWATHGTEVDSKWTLSQLKSNPEVKEKLKTLILAYEAEQKLLNATQETTPADESSQVEANSTPATATNNSNEKEKAKEDSGPTEADRARAYAALKTACGSGNNSSQSSRQSGKERRRRSRRKDNDDVGSSESETDDGDELNEFEDAFGTNGMDGLDSDDSGDEMENQATDSTTISDQESFGKIVQRLIWKFEDIQPGTVPFEESKPLLQGTDAKTTLRAGVSKRWTSPFECFQHLGCDREFVALLAQHSNDYAKKSIFTNSGNNKRLHGAIWKDISTKEMHIFLGIMLKISLMPIDMGGYPAYFRDNDVAINYNKKEQPRQIKNTKGWAYQYMSLIRFKQIRSAFHPECKSMAGEGGDKCYQLRRCINTVNRASKSTFDAGCWCSFDEGGVACRSRFCPCRQYNKDKPDKFRVDFFILACSTTYAILHLDVYQGRNAANIGIHESILDLPTTQKATMNAVMSAFGTEPRGARHLALDNRYQCPELAVLLLTKCNIYSTGTCRRRRIGWDRKVMDLEKKDGRGMYKLAVDKQNRLLEMQWVDNKVVSMVTSRNDTTIGKVKRQVGSIKKTLDCPNAIRGYQATMFGIDKGDQIRAHFGGFSTKSHFKKWYKKIFLALLDCMLLNGLVAWNLSAEEDKFKIRTKLIRHEFMMIVAESLLEYDEPEPKEVNETDGKKNPMSHHRPMEIPKGSGRPKCIVCRLECGNFFGKTIGEAGIRRNVSTCSICKVPAHNCVPASSDREIHNLPQFKGKTCFEIAHSPDGLSLWPIRANLNHKHGPRSSCRSCPAWQMLRERHGLPPKETRKRKIVHEEDDASSKDEEENSGSNGNNNHKEQALASSDDEDIYS
ncbi:unknown protein [Seminavis robusta]|uniref:PiggyBac transposable element-derived protein domain-containing protein n=1 Tax=Seminavis robusta TaxID=568900 RepID=A0A9N8ETA0_9STRA|nr:unknown protein [Seminavis robusta]|eukprot:Sro1705_g292410.1 n/a (980) ;mRNA; f:2200-5139